MFFRAARSVARYVLKRWPNGVRLETGIATFFNVVGGNRHDGRVAALLRSTRHSDEGMQIA